jgi:hypothetical protein
MHFVLNFILFYSIFKTLPPQYWKNNGAKEIRRMATNGKTVMKAMSTRAARILFKQKILMRRAVKTIRQTAEIDSDPAK